MLLAKDWEMFYSEFGNYDSDGEKLYDLLHIDTVKMRYLVDNNVSLSETEYHSSYVTKPLFDILLEAVKREGFTVPRFI